MSHSDATRRIRLRDMDALQEHHRDGTSYRHEDRYPAAANIQTPSDAELVDILQRALRGEPYPVSGRSQASPVQVPVPTPVQEAPLSSRIRDILQSDAPPVGRKAEAPISLIPETLPPAALAPIPLPLAPLPPASLEVPQPAPSVAEMMPPEFEEIPVAAVAADPSPQRRWSFGLIPIVFVAIASIAGAAIPAMLAGPPRYQAEARLQLQAPALSQPGFLDATVKRLGSPHLLSQAVAKLKLDRDPEFTGGRAGPLAIAVELLSGSGNASDAPSRAQAALRNAITVSSDPATGLMRLSVATGNAERSARIANLLADAVVYDAVVGQGAGLPGQGTAALDASRKVSEQATAALAAFKAQAGEDKIAAALDLQEQRHDLDAKAEAAEKAVVAARIRLTAAKTAKLSDVLDGSLSPDLGSSPALEDLRNRYAAAKTALSQLSTQLGPRHPRLLAQQAVVDGLRAGIQTELQRLTTSCDVDLKAALADQKAVSDRITASKGKVSGIDMDLFARLQKDAEMAQARYEDGLQTTSSTKSSAASVPLSVVLSAVAPAKPVDDNLAGAEMAGFLMGLGIALSLVFLRAWIADALLDSETAARDVGAVDHAAPEPAGMRRSEPLMEEPRAPIMPPQQRFDADIPVANDRPAPAEIPRAAVASDENLEALRRDMAVLRSKVEGYAQRRNEARR